MAIVTDSVRKVIYGQHDSDFVETVSNFFMQQYYSDMVFICQKNVQVKAHKIVLASVSQFISRIVSDNHEETLYISVPDVDHKKLQLFLTVIYKGLVQIKREDMETLKELAYFLNIPLKNATFAIVNSNTDSHIADRIGNVNNSDMPMRNVSSTEYSDCESDRVNTNDSDETVSAAREGLVNSDTPMQVKENTPSTSLKTNFNKPQTEKPDFTKYSDKNTFQSHDIDHSSVIPSKKNFFRPSLWQKKQKVSKSSAREGLNSVSNLQKRNFRVISTRKRGRICLKIQRSTVPDFKKSPSKLSESTLGGNSVPVHKKKPHALLSEEEFASVPCPLKQMRLRVADVKENFIRDDKEKFKNALLNQAVHESVTCSPNVIGSADETSESNTLDSESDSVKNKMFNSSSNRTPSHSAADISKITKESMKSVKIMLSDIVTSPVIRRQEVVPSSVDNPAGSHQNLPTDTYSIALKESETPTVNTSIQNSAVKSCVQPFRRINQEQRKRLNVLLEEFERNPYITKKRLIEVATKLNTSRDSIRSWFYRMRRKHTDGATYLNEKQKKLAVLKQEYEKNPFVTREQQREIARKLNISYESVTSLFYRMQKKQRVSDGSTIRPSANNSSLKRKRRIRRFLLQEYEKNHFPTIEQRMEMARRLNVPYKNVKLWFYRMRAKHLGRPISEMVKSTSTTTCGRRKKLKKLTFAKEQFLLQEYAKNECATEEEQKEIASRLNLPCDIVIYWFSDRQKKERGTSVSESVKSSTSTQSDQKKKKLSPLQQKYEKNHFPTSEKQMELARKLNVSYESTRMKDTGGAVSESVNSSTSTFVHEGNRKKKLSALKEKFLLREYARNKSATEDEQEEIASRLNLPCDIVISWFSDRQKKERGTLVSGNAKSSTSTQSEQKEEKEKLSVQNERRLSLEYTKNKSATEEEQREIARKLRLPCELVFSWFSDRQKKERDWLLQEEASTSQNFHHSSSLQVEEEEEEEEDPSTQEIYLTKEHSSLPLEQGTSTLPMSIKEDMLLSYPYSNIPTSSASSSSGSFSILPEIPIKSEFYSDFENREHKNNSSTESTLMSVDYVGLHTSPSSYYKGEPIVMIYKNINEDIKN